MDGSAGHDRSDLVNVGVHVNVIYSVSLPGHPSISMDQSHARMLAAVGCSTVGERSR